MVNNRKLKDPSRAHCSRRARWPYGHETCDKGDVNFKIYSAFAGVKSFPLKRMIFQFWRPRTHDGRLVFECGLNPFAVCIHNQGLCDIYRAKSVVYKYSIIDEGENPPWIISGGPLTTAFLNHFPEVVLDRRVGRGSDPLVDYRLECDLTCCVMLPIFDGDDQSCRGVVECSMNHPALLLPIFNELKRQLQRKGLRIYHVQGSWPYKAAAIPGDLEPAKIEIDKGLKIACESHDITLCHVWISCTDQMERTYLVRLSQQHFAALDDNPLKDFYDAFDVIPGEEGLAWKTLATHQSHLCRNIYKLSDNKGVLSLISANMKYTCLVICLRSTRTGELDYAFEFFWPCTRNHSVVAETLLHTLRKYLPSFKFASGEQLGDEELSSVVVENSPSEAPNETWTSVGVKRKPINNPDDDDDDVAVYALFGKQARLFYLPSSSTFENVMEKLNKEFDLDPTQTYKVNHEVCPGQWSHSNLVCLESCRSAHNMGFVKLRVLVEGIPVRWQWKTNS
ncbi:hypothetical protein SSX86_025012 [Deinandra increscens subsp. villosa]|uniref:NLP1-9 GAF domain-containing protein n=1 Tax=Deinandra increscens subsp. villosa TaxID=3103831 RepID=A0AAP0GMJ9_9ASTR